MMTLQPKNETLPATIEARRATAAKYGGAPIVATDLVLRRVHVATGGMEVFETEDKQVTQTLQGIIAAVQPGRAYYASDYRAGSTTPPDCTSIATLSRGIGNPGGDCETCPYNQWFSDPKGGRGKACKEIRRFAIVGSQGRWLLALKPTSLRSQALYRDLLRANGAEPWQVETKMTVQRIERGQWPHGVVAFELVRYLSEAELDEVGPTVKQWEDYLEALSFTAEEVSDAEADTDGTIEV